MADTDFTTWQRQRDKAYLRIAAPLVRQLLERHGADRKPFVLDTWRPTGPEGRTIKPTWIGIRVNGIPQTQAEQALSALLGLGVRSVSLERSADLAFDAETGHAALVRKAMVHKTTAARS